MRRDDRRGAPAPFRVSSPPSHQRQRSPRILIVTGLAALALFGALLWCAVIVARFHELPTWRRFLPLALFLTALVASLLGSRSDPPDADSSPHMGSCRTEARLGVRLDGSNGLQARR
ncbi:hypothetical protein GCM10023329_29620 [Streptomyces sanyensis]|uniref:Integral membrane protein n=1 Tax=Streptomyces sanyensis TaxID=568869 RepID=A0ABP9ACQ5_9ACTN